MPTHVTHQQTLKRKSAEAATPPHRPPDARANLKSVNLRRQPCCQTANSDSQAPLCATSGAFAMEGSISQTMYSTQKLFSPLLGSRRYHSEVQFDAPSQFQPTNQQGHRVQQPAAAAIKTSPPATITRKSGTVGSRPVHLDGVARAGRAAAAGSNKL